MFCKTDDANEFGLGVESVLLLTELYCCVSIFYTLCHPLVFADIGLGAAFGERHRFKK